MQTHAYCLRTVGHTDRWRRPQRLGLRRITNFLPLPNGEHLRAGTAEYLDRWFESAPIKALVGFDGIVGNYASPCTSGG